MPTTARTSPCGPKQLAKGRFDYEYGYFLAHATAVTPPVEFIAQAGVRW
nr:MULTISPECIES: hypothetical protein [Streptomyces]